MLYIQLEVILVIMDFCKRIRILCVNVVDFEWLLIFKFLWYIWFFVVKKERGYRIFMFDVNISKCYSQGQRVSCLLYCFLEWVWFILVLSMCLINIC